MSENDTLDRLVARIMQLAANAYSEGWDDRGDAGQYEEGGSLLAEYATTAAWLGEQPRDTLRTLLAPLLAAPSPSAAHAELLAEAEYGADGDLCCEMEACMTYHAENGEPPCPCPCHFAYAQRTIRRLAAALRAASPSPGAVEAAAVEYLVAEKANALAESRHKPTMAASMRLTDAYDALVRVLAPWCDDDKCAEYMTGPHYHYDDAGKEFAARRGAAGGQDG